MWIDNTKAAGKPIRVVCGRRAYEAATRVMGVVVSLVLLMAAAPVLFLCMLAIHLDSPGPALFGQERVGRGGITFRCWKLRTMTWTSDETAHRDHLRYLIENGRTVVAEHLPDDPRVTNVGRVLRVTSLDELPQLWNVLKGDMNLVGPRPPIPYEVQHYERWHLERLSVRPGLTGLWQVTGRGRVTFDEMCQLDQQYIAHRSLWEDLKILVKTPGAVVSGRGAR